MVGHLCLPDSDRFKNLSLHLYVPAKSPDLAGNVLSGQGTRQARKKLCRGEIYSAFGGTYRDLLDEFGLYFVGIFNKSSPYKFPKLFYYTDKSVLFSDRSKGLSLLFLFVIPAKAGIH